jgi:hypothetical protein
VLTRSSAVQPPATHMEADRRLPEAPIARSCQQSSI